MWLNSPPGRDYLSGPPHRSGQDRCAGGEKLSLVESSDAGVYKCTVGPFLAMGHPSSAGRYSNLIASFLY